MSFEKDKVLFVRWWWYWRLGDNNEPDCGIYAETAPGHAYAVCRCPRYLSREVWEEYASHICMLHNNATKTTPYGQKVV